jgi:hypothetical protein
MKINIWRILHTWRWPCRPKHVVKDSENQHTVKLNADGNVTCSTYWIVHQNWRSFFGSVSPVKGNTTLADKAAWEFKYLLNHSPEVWTHILYMWHMKAVYTSLKHSRQLLGTDYSVNSSMEPVSTAVRFCNQRSQPSPHVYTFCFNQIGFNVIFPFVTSMSDYFSAFDFLLKCRTLHCFNACCISYSSRLVLFNLLNNILALMLLTRLPIT